MNLHPLVNATECKDAYSKLTNFLRKGSKPLERVVGWPHGSEYLTVYWRKTERFWFAFYLHNKCYWMPFGTMDPMAASSGPAHLNITCTMSVAQKGITRRFGGVLLGDGTSGVYLAHSGKVAGGHEGVGKSSFLEHFSGKVDEIEWPDGKVQEVIILGKVGSSTLPSNIAAYLKEIDRFKIAVKEQSTTGTLSESSRISFTPEFEGARKRYRLTRAIESQCSHGTVVRALHEQLLDLRFNAKNTREIDLFVEAPHGGVSHIFEVKTDQSTSSLYGAVGQIMLHGALEKKSTRRILVLPGEVSDGTRDRLDQLGIRVLVYAWRRKAPVFRGLETVLA